MTEGLIAFNTIKAAKARPAKREHKEK